MAYNFQPPTYMVDPITGEPMPLPSESPRKVPQLPMSFKDYKSGVQAGEKPVDLMGTVSSMTDMGMDFFGKKGAGTGDVSVPQGTGGAGATVAGRSGATTGIAPGKGAGKGGAGAAGNMGYAQAAGAFIGDVVATSTSKAKYKGAQIGKTAGGGIGGVIGGIYGGPMGAQIGQMAGSLIGGGIGSAVDNKKLRRDYDMFARKPFEQLALQPNINPYGNYMEAGGAVYGNSPMQPYDSFETMYMREEPPDLVGEAFAKSGFSLGKRHFARDNTLGLVSSYEGGGAVTPVPFMAPGGMVDVEDPPKKVIPKPKGKLKPVTPLFNSEQERIDYRKAVQAESEKALQSGADANYLLETPYHKIYDEKGEPHNNCINGICGLNIGKLKWSNAPDQGRYLSNPDFSTNIQYGGEDYYQTSDNFDVGDHIQLLNMYGHPFHSQMIFKVSEDDNGKKQYHVIHNRGGDTFEARVYSEDQLKNMTQVNDNTGVAGALVYRPGKALDMPKLQAQREAANSPAVRKGAAEQRAQKEYTDTRSLDYVYKMRDDYKDKEDPPEGVKKFMEIANNSSRLKDIAVNLGVDLEDVHDELPNVLGQMMQENQGHKAPVLRKGVSLRTGAENLYETVFKPSDKSIGPGQIRFDAISPELKKQFGIRYESDLYDFNKVIPLMLGINLENRKWMRRQGDNMSEKLIGIPGVKADDLKGGIGRWTPYLYQGLPADPTTKLKRELKRDADTMSGLAGGPVEGESFDEYNTPENRRRVAYLNEEGSYADKVFHAADAILERTAPYITDEKTLQEIKLMSTKPGKKQRPASQFKKGGMVKGDCGCGCGGHGTCSHGIEKMAAGGIAGDPPTKKKGLEMFPLTTDVPAFGGQMAMSTGYRQPLQTKVSKEPVVLPGTDLSRAVTAERIKRDKNEKAALLQSRTQAVKVRSYDGPTGGLQEPTYTFPDGTTKPQSEMNWREKAYVAGKNLGSLQNDDWTDFINPAAWLGGLTEGLGTAPYEAKRTNSNMPYVMGVGAPLLTGAIAGIGAPTMGEFANNLVNPVAGFIGSPQEFKSLYNTIVTKLKNNPGAVLTAEEQGILKNVRNIGTIYQKSKVGTPESRLNILRNIEKRSANLSDDQLKGLIGTDKEGLRQQISGLEVGPTPPAEASNPFATTTGDDFDIDMAAAMRQSERNRMREQFRQLDAAQAEPINAEELDRFRQWFRDRHGYTPNEVDLPRTRGDVATAMNQLAPPPAEIHLPNLDVPMRRRPSTQAERMGRLDEYNTLARELGVDSGRQPISVSNDTFNRLNQSQFNSRWDELNSRVEGLNPDVITEFTRKYKPESIASRLKKKVEDYGYMGREPMPSNTKDLLFSLSSDATNNPAAVMRQAYNKMKAGKKGESFMSAGSLSTDSAPMSLAMTNKALDEGLVSVGYHGKQSTNRSGFPTKAGVHSDVVVKEMNATIDKINSKLKKKIPYAQVDEYGDVYYPTLTVTRKKEGGMITRQDNPLNEVEFFKKGGKNWIKGAVNPAHKGYCTPMTKSTCTPRRKAFARTMKKHHGFHEDGGIITNHMRNNPIEDIMYEDMPNQDTTMYMAEGGYAEQPEEGAMSGAMDQQEAAQPQQINIQKGELRVSLDDFEIIQEYNNPNRFSKHHKDPMKEPIGNFVMVDEGDMIIPTEYAETYKYGDTLTRKSIIAEILKGQRNNPEQNEPRTGRGGGAGAEYAAAGYLAMGEDPGYKYVRGMGWVPSSKPPAVNAAPAVGFGPGGPGTIAFGPGGPGAPIPKPTYSIEDSAVSGLPQFPDNAQNAAGNNVWNNEIETAPPKRPVTTPVVPERTTPNWGLLASKAASVIPTAYGITNALGADPYLHYDENYGYNDALSYASGMETNPNTEASKAAMNQALAAQLRQLNNINSPSVRSEAGAAKAGLLRSFGEISQNASNAAMELRNKKRETLGNLKVNQGQNRLDMRMKLMDELRMDQANRESLVHQGLSEGATNFQQGIMDEERIKSINQFAEFYNLDPYNAKLLMDQKQFLPYVQEAMDAMQRQIVKNQGAKATTTATKKKG